MDKFRYSLITIISHAVVASKNANNARKITLVLSLTILPLAVQAANNQSSYETYVIHTYGGEALLPAVRQQLNSSRDGGTVAIYQDKLVLSTTASNYCSGQLI